MKKENTEEKMINDYKNRVEFMVDAITESLFDYSSDSLKVPALNFHFLCEEFLLTHRAWERGEISKGNLIPLIEEIEANIKRNHVSSKKIRAIFDSFYDASGKLNKIPNDIDFKIKHYKLNIDLLQEIFATDFYYLNTLKNKIIECIFGDEWETQKQDECYLCIRDLLVELINYGTSKSSLYYQTSKFSEKISHAEFTREDIENFFDCIMPKEKSYDVILGVSDEAYYLLKPFLKNFRKANQKEKSKLKSNYVIAFTNVENLDVCSAIQKQKKFLYSLSTAINFNKHSINIVISSGGFAKEKKEEKFSFVKDPVNSLVKNKNKTESANKEFVKTFIKNISNISEMARVFELHDSALSSNEQTNQLLNLWTIIEILIEMPQDSMDKINHICNVLVSVLNKNYLLDYVDKLYCDINKEVNIDDILNSQVNGETKIEKFVAILFNKGEGYKEIINRLGKNCLYAYRVKKFAEQVFYSSENLYEFMENHSKRLRWHIMRIYRNRCMIVHNGDNMPYIESILENLHYYVDVLIEFLFDSYKNKHYFNAAAYQQARALDACRKNILLDDNKKEVKYLPLSEENLIQYVFNKF